jgi:hypothetical protein
LNSDFPGHNTYLAILGGVMSDKEQPRTKFAFGVQVTALALAALAIAWGLFAVYSLIYPGPSGEWAGLAVLAAYVVNVPVGLAALIVGLAVKRGSPRPRKLCIVFSVIVLCLPVVASLVWRH